MAATEYQLHLSRDKRLAKLIQAKEPFLLRKRRNLFHYLCASVISQQLSTKVATVIHNRFLTLFGNRQPQPEDVLGLPLETLRQIGLSESKAGYMIHLARFALEQGLSVKKLSRMDDEAVIDYLTQIKGVGRWTAEMVMMFALGREDVFAVDDLGIQQAMIKLFQLDGTDKKKLKEDMLRISRKWSPYRTYACLHLWAWKDNK
ncbi:MAG: hypothetical protein RL732_931 [Bacteroidota bacterium]